MKEPPQFYIFVSCSLCSVSVSCGCLTDLFSWYLGPCCGVEAEEQLAREARGVDRHHQEGERSQRGPRLCEQWGARQEESTLG